jgi:uncharacterized integral membrane protein (TIGR00697 family)
LTYCNLLVRARIIAQQPDARPRQPHPKKQSVAMSVTPEPTHTFASDARPAQESAYERRRGVLLLVLAAFFVGNALLAELVGGKLFKVHTPAWTWILSAGIVLWPVVFIMTDIINEYFGRVYVRRLSLIVACVIAYAYLALGATRLVKADPEISPVQDEAFNQVLFQSQWIIVGSIIAFLVAQLVDVTVFWFVRRRTGHRMLWLRAQGSTVVSQLIDTFIVQFIGLYLPWRLGFNQEYDYTFRTYLIGATSGYVFKVIVAIAVTPALYVVHALIDRYLGARQSQVMIEGAAAKDHASDQQTREAP